jgi:hypothetical protein
MREMQGIKEYPMKRTLRWFALCAALAFVFSPALGAKDAPPEVSEDGLHLQ